MHLHLSSFDSEFHHVVHDLLARHIDSVHKAAEKFAGPIEDKYMQTRNPDDVESPLSQAWGAVVAAATATSHTDTERRDRLVELVLAVRARPTLESHGEVCKVFGGVVWKDLPVFGAEMREKWDVATASDQDPTEKQQHWLNLNAFAASLVPALRSVKAETPNFALYAIWTIRTALEESSADEKPDATAIRAAALWLTHDADVLWSASCADESFQGKMARGGSLLDGEFNGFSKDRWQFWKKRLGEVGEQGLGDEARRSVEEALAAMAKAEQ